MEWQSYISSGTKLYLGACNSQAEHDRCIATLKNLIAISEAYRGKNTP